MTPPMIIIIAVIGYAFIARMIYLILVKSGFSDDPDGMAIFWPITGLFMLAVGSIATIYHLVMIPEKLVRLALKPCKKGRVVK